MTNLDDIKRTNLTLKETLQINATTVNGNKITVLVGNHGTVVDAVEGGKTLNTSIFFKYQEEFFELHTNFDYYVFSKDNKNYNVITIKEAHRIISEYEEKMNWKDIMYL